MLPRPAVLAALCCVGPPVHVPAAAAQDAPSAPSAPAALFQDEAPLRLTLKTDLRALFRDRDAEREDHPATLTYVTPAGDTTSVPVALRTRGIFRLQRCAFPPLRLDLPRRRLDGTPFAGEDKLKLVTHCRDQRSFEQNLLQEYALYRVFNAVTHRGFRARLARVTYVDSVRADTITRYAVLLESAQALARRLGTEIVDAPNVYEFLIDDAHMTEVAVFQYLIGNTDWSVWGPHNITIVRDTVGRLYAIPYDFDFAGVIAAPYAVPAPQLPIRSVRERLYRGFCQPDSLLATVLARFRAVKDSIYAAYRAVPDLQPGDLRRALGYFDEFYRTIDDPGAVRREFVRGCRRVPT